MERMLEELHRMDGVNVHLYSYRYGKMVEYNCTIRLDNDEDKLEIRRKSERSFPDALQQAFDAFMQRSTGWSKAELFPNLLEHQADEADYTRSIADTGF